MHDKRVARLTDRYNRDAIAYRDLWAPVLRVASAKLLGELGDLRPARVLDIGTGVGALLPDVITAFPGASLLGVDRAHGMLKLAPAGVSCAVTDAGELAIRAGSMDLALMVFMLFHMNDPADGLREARRVLRPGGRIATLTWGEEWESEATRVWVACLDAHGASGSDPRSPAHEIVDTPEKMDALLQTARFQNVRSWAEDLAVRLDMEEFLQLKTRVGHSRQRFESLGMNAREACVSEARRSMQALSPDQFKMGGGVVFAVAGT